MKLTRFILLLMMVFIIQDCNNEKFHFTIYTIGDSTLALKECIRQKLPFSGRILEEKVISQTISAF